MPMIWIAFALLIPYFVAAYRGRNKGWHVFGFFVMVASAVTGSLTVTAVIWASTLILAALT